MKSITTPKHAKTNVPVKHRMSDATLLNIEAAIKLIPYAGGFLATYFGEIRAKRARQRMLEFFDYFSARLDELDEKKLDKKYLQSDEFAELFAQGAEEAARSTTQRRIWRFANILINNALLGAQSRSRTQSIMSFVDRISDLDAFVLLCYGNPRLPSMRASTKSEAFKFVCQLANYLSIDCPEEKLVIESIVYMDNLGITWVNEKQIAADEEKGKDLILKEFSSFRTPLGDAVAAVIAPPSFYKEDVESEKELNWPDDHISDLYRNAGLRSFGKTAVG
jgi:hypothetical protein